MEHTTFVGKVLAFLKGGDEAKVVRFETKLTKYFKKQIAMREETVENLQDKITDAKDSLADAVVNVDVDNINTADSVEEYVTDYVSNVGDILSEIEDLEGEIEDVKEEIKRLQTLQSTIFPA